MRLLEENTGRDGRWQFDVAGFCCSIIASNVALR